MFRMDKMRMKPKSAPKPSNDGKVLGRSALTGQFVYKPAPAKGGSISQNQANSAVARVYEARASR